MFEWMLLLSGLSIGASDLTDSRPTAELTWGETEYAQRQGNQRPF